VSGRTVYLDPSAILVLVLGGAGAGELTTALRGTSTRVTSIVSRAEVQRAVQALDPTAVPRAVELLSRFALMGLDGAVVTQATNLRPGTLPALGAVHVASAMSLAESLDAFLTYDPLVAEAARGANLRVESPGVELATVPAALPEEVPGEATPGALDEAVLMRVVDRMVGRLRPERIIVPEGAADAPGILRLAMVPGPWSPGRGASWVAQEAIEDLDVRFELVLVDEDTPEPAGRIVYQLP
jgi:hypothetical protein